MRGVNIFSNDDIWVIAKKLSKSHGKINDWTEAMTFYNKYGGSHIKMTLLDKGQQLYQFIANMDNGQSLVVKPDGNIISVDKEIAEKAKKIFCFIDNGSNVITFKAPYTIKDGFDIGYVE